MLDLHICSIGIGRVSTVLRIVYMLAMDEMQTLHLSSTSHPSSLEEVVFNYDSLLPFVSNRNVSCN